MKSRLTSFHDCIILDACCVMNLYASRKMAEIVASIAEDVTVTTYVKEVEALFVYRRSKYETPADKEKVDLRPLIEAGLICVVNFESEIEKSRFVDLTAQRLDDGEAATGAIAIHRNWAIATDDRRSRSVFKLKAPAVQLVSTSELVKHWVDHTKPEGEVVRQALQEIETRANYLISRRDPWCDWWQNHKG